MQVDANKRFLTIYHPIILALLLLPFFKPISLEYFAPAIDTLFDIWKIGSAIIIFGLYLFYYHRLSNLILAITAYEFALFFSTLINDGDYWKFAVNCVTVIGFCMLTELCMKRNCERYFSVVYTIYFLIILVNFVLLLIFPKGVAVDDYYHHRYNFLGYDNGLAVLVMVPLMGISCIYSAFRKKKLTFSAVATLSMISATVLITWSATGVVAWFVMIAYILFVYRGQLTKYFNSYALFATFLVLQVMIVFLRFQENFSFIIENILGKSITLTGRTEIWDLTYSIILQSPIIGHGVYKGYGLVYWENHYMYSHNAVLEILTQSGVIGLMLFAIPFIMAAVKLYKYRKHFLSGIVTVTLFAFLMTYLAEAQITAIWVFGFLTIAACIPNIIQQYEDYALQTNLAADRFHGRNHILRPYW